MKKISIILFVILIFPLLGSMCKSDVWQGFYYPDGCLTCEENYIFSPTFTMLEECRDWADSIKIKLGNNPNDQYECGLNCKKREGGFNICEKTVE